MSKKKANGEGSVSKRSDGRYMARYTVDGKRKTIYGSTHEEVRRKLNEQLNLVAKGIYVADTKGSFGQWLREWLTTYALPTVKQSTYISYEGYVRLHLEPELGKIKLTSLTTEQLQRFFNKKYRGTSTQKGLSAKTLKNIYNMLNAVLNQAIANKKLTYSPLPGVKLPSNKKKKMRVLEPEEQIALHLAAKKSETLAAFGIIFTLNTGVRLGELVGFQRKDLNYRTHSIDVQRTLGRLQKVDEDGNLLKKETGVKTTELVIRSPKSDEAVRNIPLFAEVWNDLIDYLAQVDDMLDALGVPHNKETPIFCTPLGTFYDPRTYEDLFKRTLKAAELDNINFHALRHTFATRALENNMDVETLSSILGHAQASTTLNMYGHALPNHRKKSMERMSTFYVTEIDTTAEDDFEDENLEEAV